LPKLSLVGRKWMGDAQNSADAANMDYKDQIIFEIINTEQNYVKHLYVMAINKKTLYYG